MVAPYSAKKGRRKYSLAMYTFDNGGRVLTMSRPTTAAASTLSGSITTTATAT
jgi:hypothetical protein